MTGAPDDSLNVLVLMSDEQRWDSVGFAGNPAARSPVLDELAERSTVFERCYTPFPLCCPSRTSLWTGRMPRHHHVLGNWRPIDSRLGESGLGVAFRDAGYHTLYCGKWHVPGTTPAQLGFAATAAIPAVLNGRDRGRYIEAYREYAARQGYELVEGHIENLTPTDVAALRSAPHRATAEIEEEHFLESWQTREFLRALDERPGDRPWFAVCSFNAPHFPMVVPQPYDRLIDRAEVRLPDSFATGPATKPREVAASSYAAKYADLDEAGWRDMLAHYLGLCALVDTQVGAILQHLGEELERTIIVFTTDHGDMMGSHRLMEKGHQLHYEEALRVPLIIRHPAQQEGTRTTNLVSVVDIARTLAELAGVPWDEDDDGVSFARMIASDEPPATRTHVTAETVLYDMESEANGEYVDPRTWAAERDGMNLSVRTDRVRYVYRSRDIDELYDHESDPGEQVNLAAAPGRAAERGELRRLLANEVADVWPGVARTLTES
ncbi:sulfatase-like hydrolase/transferase [Pseudactinotalea terrae]|uniref:sulfatase-like hydrolase/transferase n=1 Tax=Pseudactinotalea terrae TaxID=1743262 RepID=UPI0012E32A8E|nr:sulfatase-like hydrolase/transferase [Pseudactinotalea terrae]